MPDANGASVLNDVNINGSEDSSDADQVWETVDLGAPKNPRFIKGTPKVQKRQMRSVSGKFGSLMMSHYNSI